VSSARVTVDGEIVGAIDRGLLVYLGVGRSDGDADVERMVGKLAGLRVFEDEAGKMSRSVADVGGGVLVVSQFTLFGDVRRGLRPSFTAAAPPEEAERRVEEVVAGLAARGLRVATGRFRATMDVLAVVAGPVTVLVDTERCF
jgi:D-tyrosyl-tRNA(Tyr) deacylase